MMESQRNPWIREEYKTLAEIYGNFTDILQFRLTFSEHALAKKYRQTSSLPARSAGALLKMSTKKQTADTTRPTDTATLEARRKNDEMEANFLFQTRAFLPKNGEIGAHFFCETGAFLTKNGEIEAHFLLNFKSDHFC